MDRVIKKKKFSKGRLLWSGLAMLIAAVVLYVLITGSGSKSYKVERSRLTIDTVTYGDFMDVVSIQGTVEPLTSIYITAPEGGNVEEIYVEDGAFVMKGDPLLRLSNTALMLDYMNRETQIIEQINNLRNTRLSIEENKRSTSDQLIDVRFNHNEAKRQYKVDSALFIKGAISEDAYLDSKNTARYLNEKEQHLKESIAAESANRKLQLSRIDNSIDLMERNLEAIRANLDNLVIKAPITGQLTSFNPELGESKSRGQSLGTIAVPDGYKVHAMIDEFYLSKVQVGQLGTGSYNGQEFHLAVSRVIPEVSNGRFTAYLVFIDSTAPKITRGQSLQIKLALSNTFQTALLPKGAFYQSTGGKWIFVLEEPNRAVKRDIALGRQSTDFIEVVDGLKRGEKVILNGYSAYGEAIELEITD